MKPQVTIANGAGSFDSAIRQTSSSRAPMLLRANRKRASRRVLVHGLTYFGKAFAELMNGDGWEFRYYPDSGIGNLTAMARELKACDLVYQVGGRVTRGKFLRAAHFLDKQKIVMHWVGSDTLDEQKDVENGKADPWVLLSINHWAESEWMVREVNALGLPCERVPLPSAYVPDQMSAPPEEFRVLVYVPTVVRGKLYGLDHILQVVRELPEVPFDLVGLRDGPLPCRFSNLHVYGRMRNLEAFYRKCPVLWRPVRHDGLSWMVMEALGHGRHVLWTYPFPGCVQVASAEDASAQIVRLRRLHQMGSLRNNLEGAEFLVRGGYQPKLLRHEICSRLEAILDA